jgi:hypothetical protein
MYPEFVSVPERQPIAHSALTAQVAAVEHGRYPGWRVIGDREHPVAVGVTRREIVVVSPLGETQSHVFECTHPGQSAAALCYRVPRPAHLQTDSTPGAAPVP